MMVDAVKTPITPRDVVTALRVAWVKLFGMEPADKSIAILAAHSALETGRWKSCWNFNLGNMKPGLKWKGDTCQFRLNEVIKKEFIENGKKVVRDVVEWFDPPHPQTTMRAYPSLEVAAEDYLQMLNRRFAAAWNPVLNGAPVAFSMALKSMSYYTAPEAPYRKELVSLFNEFLKVVADVPKPSPEPSKPPPDRGLEALALSVAATDAVDEIREEAKKEL